MTAEEALALCVQALEVQPTVFDPNGDYAAAEQMKDEALAAAEAYAKTERTHAVYFDIESNDNAKRAWWSTMDDDYDHVRGFTSRLRAESALCEYELDEDSVRIVRVDETRTVIADAAPEPVHAAGCGGWTREIGGWFMTGECTCGASAVANGEGGGHGEV